MITFLIFSSLPRSGQRVRPGQPGGPVPDVRQGSAAAHDPEQLCPVRQRAGRRESAAARSPARSTSKSKLDLSARV